MISRLGPLFLLALMLIGASSLPSAAQSPIPFVEIYLDNLPQPLRLADADADAFQRRLNRPPLLEARPIAGGVSIGVDTPYWDAALRESPDGPQVGIGGQYYQDGGFVELDRGGRAAWIVLDLRQRAILDRYIRFANEGAIGPQPSALEMIVLAAAEEPVGVEVGGRVLSQDEKLGLWDVIDVHNGWVTQADAPLPPAGDAGYWFVFTLPEGRSLQYYYDPAAGTLTDALVTETFDVHLSREATLPEPNGAPQVEQQSPRGSWLWWPVMLGGGSVFLALAVWLQRRNLRPG